MVGEGARIDKIKRQHIFFFFLLHNAQYSNLIDQAHNLKNNCISRVERKTVVTQTYF